ncbi:lysine transporter LysE [Opitutaceae bacterium TAV5]|nr:lysine transporter LysE [Opitutaceae bacterium TAV5]
MFPQLVTLLGILTVGLLSPGPDFFLIVRNSMSGSRARAFATGWGIAAGLGLQVTALSLGLAVAPALVLRTIQLAGALFLAWIGLKALLARPAADAVTVEEGGRQNANAPASAAALPVAAAAAVRQHLPADRDRKQAAAGFMEGFLCNVTNVKVFVFFVSLFSQFVTAESAWQWRVLMPVTVVVHGAVMWLLITWALLFPPVARQLARAQRWLPRAFGVVLLGFAAWVVREALR